MNRFLVIIEPTATGYSAYSPDLPGCIATGSSVAEAESNMYSAIQMHIEGLREDDAPIPPSSAIAEYVVVA